VASIETLLLGAVEALDDAVAHTLRVTLPHCEREGVKLEETLVELLGLAVAEEEGEAVRDAVAVALLDTAVVVADAETDVLPVAVDVPVDDPVAGAEDVAQAVADGVAVAVAETVALPVAVEVPVGDGDVTPLVDADAVGDQEDVSVLLPVAVAELPALSVAAADEVEEAVRDAVAVALRDAAVAVADAEAVALPVAVDVPIDDPVTGAEYVALAVAVDVPLLVADAVAVAEGVSLVITAFRTRWEPAPSVQYTVAGVPPSTGTATRLMGCVREANAPLPLEAPAAPSWPTGVETTPEGVTARIAELALSVTSHAPCALFHATPAGK